jgi:hypothetical protein
MQWLWDRWINKGVMQPLLRQQIGKHIPLAMNTHTTVELLLDTVFSTQSVQRGYEEDNWSDSVQLRVELYKGGWEEMAL